MRVHLCVEGPADEAALRALLGPYLRQCRQAGWGVRFAVMRGKVRLLKDIGRYCAAVLAAEPLDHVVAMPDLYPTSGMPSGLEHASHEQLCGLLRGLVGQSLPQREPLQRFHAHPFRYDMECLLLAVPDRLRRRLGTSDSIERTYRHPVEDQDDDTPPKRKVEQLFLSKHRRRAHYEDVVDAPAVLAGVSLPSLCGSPELPRFGEFLDMLQTVTAVPI